MPSCLWLNFFTLFKWFTTSLLIITHADNSRVGTVFSSVYVSSVCLLFLKNQCK